MERSLSDPFKPILGVVDGGGESRSRDSLFLMAQLRSPALREVFDVRIRNLSAGGLMADFARPLDRDTPVEVDVRGIGWVAGRIAWCTEGRTGIAFDKPIDPRLARKPVGARADDAIGVRKR